MNLSGAFTDFVARFALHACVPVSMCETVMQLMGHKDIESTLRYWRPVEMEQLRGKMGEIFQ
jgi:integrase